MKRRQFAIATASGLALPLVSNFEAFAADPYPSRPIQVIVPYAAGGADTFIRPLQPDLEKKHGIRLVIESVVGAGGTVGSAKVKRSAADGYTLLFCGSGALTVAPRIQPNAPVLSDFEPIVNMVTIPYFIATKAGSPITDLRSFVDFIKSKPGALNYGSPGVGSSPHLGMEAIAGNLGTTMTHVPYSGIATALQALLGGHIDAVIGAPGNIMPQVEAGAVNAIAVVSKSRFPLTPKVPAIAEAGVELDVSTHFAFYAPKGTPTAVIKKLAAAFSDAGASEDYKKGMEAKRTRVEILSAETLTKELAQEYDRFGPLISAIKK